MTLTQLAKMALTAAAVISRGVDAAVSTLWLPYSRVAWIRFPDSDKVTQVWTAVSAVHQALRCDDGAMSTVRHWPVTALNSTAYRIQRKQRALQ